MRYEILNASGDVENTIIASLEFVEAQHAGRWRLSANQDPPDTIAQPRHISVGAFFDRFGPLKWAILADQSPAVQAVVRDASVRKFIDLDNPDLPAGLQIIVTAGHSIDPAAIIGAPVEGSELP